MEFYGDTQKCLDYAKEKAEEKGLAKGMAQGHAKALVDSIQRMLAKGFDWKLIEEITGVQEDKFPDLQSTATT